MATKSKVPGTIVDAKWDGEGVRIRPGCSWVDPGGIKIVNTKKTSIYIKSMKWKVADAPQALDAVLPGQPNVEPSAKSVLAQGD